jgi:hypothetical protein
VAAIREGQRALQRRVLTFEATVEELQTASQDTSEIAADGEALSESTEALDQRIEALEQHQP